MESIKRYKDNRAWIEININHLRKNIEAFERILPKHCKIMAAVKADAYGHGAVMIAKFLQYCNITNFCVASVQEGIELRQSGITGNILILSYTPPELLEEIIFYDLIQTIIDLDYAYMLKEYKKDIRVHLGIDTGMHRIGVRAEHIEEIIKLWNINNLHIEGIFSHLCVADSLKPENIAYTKEQIEKFNQVLQTLEQKGKNNFFSHLQSSYGVLNYPDCQYDFARLGISLYGVLSAKSDKTRLNITLNPVLSLKSRISCIKELKSGEKAGYGLEFETTKDCKIAVISIGYADGIPRNLPGQSYVLCKGKKAFIIGRICMDQMLIDVTDIADAKPHDEVVLIGTQQKERITAEMVADWSGTISNEILSRLGKRLERRIQKD